MAKISFNGGSGEKKANFEHNRRNRKVTDAEEHIDKNGVHENWVDHKHFKEYFNAYFENDIRDFNIGKRKSRQIDNMYNHVTRKNQKHPDKSQKVVYEIVAGVYPEEGETLTIAQERAILKEYVDNWKKLNPNLELVGAYYHADEQGKAPHVHLDYFPVATGYTNGPARQPGLTRALQQQGIKKDMFYKTEQSAWQQSQRLVLRDICRKHDIEVNLEVEEKREHMSTEMYKMYAELQSIKKEKEKTQELSSSELRSCIERKSVFGTKDYVKVSTKDLNAVLDELGALREQKDEYKELMKEAEAEKQSARQESARASGQAEQTAKLNIELQKNLKVANLSATEEKRYIRTEAKKMFNEFMSDKGFKSDFTAYLEQYCKEHKLKNGKTVYDSIKELYEANKKKVTEEFNKRMEIQKEIDEPELER